MDSRGGACIARGNGQFHVAHIKGLLFGDVGLFEFRGVEIQRVSGLFGYIGAILHVLEAHPLEVAVALDAYLNNEVGIGIGLACSLKLAYIEIEFLIEQTLGQVNGSAFAHLQGDSACGHFSVLVEFLETRPDLHGLRLVGIDVGTSHGSGGYAILDTGSAILECLDEGNEEIGSIGLSFNRPGVHIERPSPVVAGEVPCACHEDGGSSVGTTAPSGNDNTKVSTGIGGFGCGQRSFVIAALIFCDSLFEHFLGVSSRDVVGQKSLGIFYGWQGCSIGFCAGLGLVDSNLQGIVIGNAFVGFKGGLGCCQFLCNLLLHLSCGNSGQESGSIFGGYLVGIKGQFEIIENNPTVTNK